MRIEKSFGVVAIALAAALASPYAASTAITSPAGLIGTTTTIDFSQFTGGGQITATNGPVQLGGLVGQDIPITDLSAGSNIWLYNDFWGLLDNGSWNSGRNGFLGIFPSNGPVRINFNTANISGFGFFMNVVADADPQFEPVILSAYDSGGNLLESFNVTSDADISTPGGVNDGAFRGIQRAGFDIAYIELLGDTAVFDNLQFVSGNAVVPLPSTLALLGLGLGWLGFARRKAA